MAHCVTHMLNLLLCPHPFLHTLNNGTVKFQDETVQTQFPICPDSAQSHSPRDYVAPDKQAAPQQKEISKKEAKKLRQKAKKEESKDSTATGDVEDTDKTMSDILFQTPLESSDLFNCKDFFSNSYFAEGLNRVELSAFFTLTPAQLYTEMREIAKVRFGCDLPEQKKLACLASSLQKASLLRDICRSIGVQLKAQPYTLTNNAKQVATHHNDL